MPSFIESLESQGVSAHTRDEYVSVVRRLAEFYHQPLDRISDQEILAFRKHLKTSKSLSDGSIISALCGLKAFYTQVLHRAWTIHWKAPAHHTTSWFPDALRQGFLEDLQLQGLSARTQQAYVRTVRQLADHAKKSPDDITEEDLRQYFLPVKNVKKWSRATMTQSLCGIKRFFEHILHREWNHVERGATGQGETPTGHPHS